MTFGYDMAQAITNDRLADAERRRRAKLARRVSRRQRRLDRRTGTEQGTGKGTVTRPDAA